MDVLSNRNSATSTDENALYKTLTSSTNSNNTLQAMLASGSSSTALTQYLSNYTGDSSTNLYRRILTIRTKQKIASIIATL